MRFSASLAAIAGAVLAMPASACAWLPRIVVEAAPVTPPEHLTEPEEIAQWEREQADIALADARAEQLQRDADALQDWRNYMRQLEVEAGRFEDMSALQLADDLAVAMVPPVLPQIRGNSDCGPVIERGEIYDPAGYLLSGTSQVELFFVGQGVVSWDNLEERRNNSLLRRYARHMRECNLEAPIRVGQMLADRFSQQELSHVWQEIHRLDFNRNSVESGDQYYGRRKFRLLAFEQGRSGRMTVFDPAIPNNSPTFRPPQLRLELRNNGSAIRDFLSENTVALHMIEAIAEALAGPNSHRCSQATAQMEQVKAELQTPYEQRAWVVESRARQREQARLASE